MLGFATVDLSTGDSTLTVWLTSRREPMLGTRMPSSSIRATTRHLAGRWASTCLAAARARHWRCQRNSSSATPVQPIRPCRYDS